MKYIWYVMKLSLENVTWWKYIDNNVREIRKERTNLIWIE